MADTLKFDDVLSVMKENNPKLLESWKDRKISGAKTILDSKLRRKVVDEVRFKLRGGAQIAFIGDDDQEKLIKIVGGRERAQKSLDYIRMMTEENADSLTDEDRVASEILTTSLEKYIKILEARQAERNIVKKNPLPTIAEMQGTMESIDKSDKTDKEKQKEKKDYMISMQDKYKKELDKLKHKLEGIRLKIGDKGIITKTSDDGVEVKNFEAINNLYEQFQSLTMSVYDYGQTYEFIKETLDRMKEERATAPIRRATDPKVPPVPYFAKPKRKGEEVKDEQKDKDEEKEKVIPIDIPKKPKTRDSMIAYIDGKLCYEGARYRDKVWMKRKALDLDIEKGNRRESFITRTEFGRNLVAMLPNRALKRSAIHKISNDEINMGELYDIMTLGELRWESRRLLAERDEQDERDEYDDELFGEFPEESVMDRDDIRKQSRKDLEDLSKQLDEMEMYDKKAKQDARIDEPTGDRSSDDDDLEL